MVNVSFLLTLVGLGIAATRAVQIFRMGIDARIFGAIVERLLRTRDTNKCRKLCAAVGETPLAAATTALLETRLFPRGASEADARAMLRDAFNRAFQERAAPIAAYRFTAWLALALLVGPALHGYFMAALTIQLVCASLLGLALLAWTARAAAKVLASGPHVLDRALPHALALLLDPVSTYRSPEASQVEEQLPPIESVVLGIARNGVSEGTQIFEQPVIKIGRIHNAHLVLDDPTVARMHAVIERDSEGVSIIDLGSGSGTFVNDAKVNKAKLAHGDVVGIGPYRLTVGGSLVAGSSPVLRGEPRETDDPRTWGRLAAVLYGFETRSPDLFFDVVGSCITSRARIAKVRRKEGSPHFLVVVLAERVEDLTATRRRIEEHAAALYRSYATPAVEIAPDATYGAETSTHARLLADVLAGETEVLATRIVNVPAAE